jgi:hypothetical protein
MAPPGHRSTNQSKLKFKYLALTLLTVNPFNPFNPKP